ncbi:MAG: DUF429 domain-containing protein [Sumerlaeia bacterium]
MERTQVAGMDGCKGGWLVVTWTLAEDESFEAFFAATFRQALERLRDATILAVDMPIGLLDAQQPGGRSCDQAARRLLTGQTSSVFSAPIRGVLSAENYQEALALSRSSSEHEIGLSQQSWNIAPRIREVDDVMTPELQRCIREIHPELCFRYLNAGVRLPKKKSAEGREVRRGLLRSARITSLEEIRASARQGATDDFLDACAACECARRILEGRARRVPEGEPPRDSKGLRMEMWY